MNNFDYEAASITAAHKLKQIDAQIKTQEEALKRLAEQRREIINRYELNKPCDSVACMGKGPACAECGKEIAG